MPDDAARLEGAEARLWDAAIKGLRGSRRWQFWIKIVLILAGAALGAIGGGMEGPLRPADAAMLTLKGLLVIGGGLMAFAGGALLLFVDEDAPAIVAEARMLAVDARRFLHERDAFEARAAAAEAAAERLDHKRRERLTAIEQMLEVVEAALLEGADAAEAARGMLRHAIHSIRKAVEYEGGDFFTISIFKREDRGEGERLYRIAAEWSDPEKAGEDGRSWPRGKGYSGVAWNNAVGNPGAEVIEPDTSLPHIASQYPVDGRDPVREALYRSVAAMPILIGEANDVWGVVTATSDRPHIFRHGSSNLGTQNAALVRDVARFAGLLAGIERVARPGDQTI